MATSNYPPGRHVVGILTRSMSSMDNNIVVSNASQFDPAGGIVVIDFADANWNISPSSTERIEYKGVTKDTLWGLTRGLGTSIAQAHATGAIVQLWPYDIAGNKTLPGLTLTEYMKKRLLKNI